MKIKDYENRSCNLNIINTVMQTWNNEQARKQCLCKFLVFGVNFLNVPALYIENAQKGLCKATFAKFACVNEKQYSMSVKNS